ncbi:phosphoribosyl-ATP pyrophosphohydrolase [Paenibacillus sp. sgz500958]|uniref:phosphoribosyl-ATP pyrophosphohydrolase n=1 Tax=Paenibacillus sp. sgz500958 TaxID=3242475 RepID=UPI0036D2ED90
MPVYNKLVRDGIPELIASQGRTCRTRILDAQEYTCELRKKLAEETEEYLQSESDPLALEELADIMEVILALAERHGGDEKVLESIRVNKAQARGRFKERIFLLET